MEKNKIRSNIWKIYLYKFISEFYLIVPILIPYYHSNSLNKTQIFTIQASYALAVLVLEIPSGYLADVIGRKKTLLIGAACFPLGLAIYAFTDNFLAFVIAEFVIAIANSMRSGCDSALIYDTLIQMKQENEYTKFEGRSFFYTRIGTSVSSVLGGFLALVSLRFPFYINIISASLMFPIALFLIEPSRKKLVVTNPFRDIISISRFSLSHVHLRRLILFAALIVSTGIIGVWAYFLYYGSLGLSIGLFGIIFALFQLASALGSKNAYIIEKKIGQKFSFSLLLLIAPVFILLGIFNSTLLIPAILFNGFLWGISFPLIMNSMNRLIKSEMRATVLSVANMSCSLSYVILAPLFGKLVDSLSLSTSFVILGIYFLFYGLWILFLILHPNKSIQ
jgi:MFS family permease